MSLAQLLAYGVAGFVIGNCVPESNNKGLKLGLNPWVAVVAALIITTIVALVLGALSSRTFGIYFLMLTLTYAVIGYYVFGQVATISGFGGITGLDPPTAFDSPLRLYYLALAFSVLAYIGFRADSSHAVRCGARRHTRRPGADGVSGIPRSAPSGVGVHPCRLRRGDRGCHQRVVERPDRPEHRVDR